VRLLKQLTILRHAKSSWADRSLDDFDRPLNGRGRDAAEAVGRELRQLEIRFDCVLASSALRVRGTVEHFMRGFGELPDIDFRSDIYAAPVQRLEQSVRTLPEQCASALLVGHNPGMQQLVLALCDPGSPERQEVAVKYPTAAATILRFAADQWFAVASGEIASLVVPRKLDGR
jgi:phosphohistidine phosphatase